MVRCSFPSFPPSLFPPMAPQTKRMLWKVVGLLAAFLPALGWALTTADARYVHKTDYERQQLVDSIKHTLMQQTLDEINTRVQQIQCGKRIEDGCR